MKRTGAKVGEDTAKQETAAMPPAPIQGPIIALSGTPGTGKTSAALHLAKKGHGVVSLSRFKDDPRFDLGRDADRDDTHMLDENALEVHLKEHLHEHLESGYRPPVFIESHLAHMLGFVDRIIVLRCRPSVLRKRLEKRGYSEQKIRENLEAEGMDLILQEAVLTREQHKATGHKVHLAEVDTTTTSVDDTAIEILRLATTEPANLEIGRLDWSDEVLGWY